MTHIARARMATNLGACQTQILDLPSLPVEGDNVTQGNDTFEWRDSTPPAGGTAGRIWVYRGAAGADSRTNLVAAINGTVSAATITYPAAGIVEHFLASLSGTSVRVVSATNPGGQAFGSATAKATTSVLTDPASGWRGSVTVGGAVGACTDRPGFTEVVISNDMLTAGSLTIGFPFEPDHAAVRNRSRDQDEHVAISGRFVTLTLAGGATPNNQLGDTVEFLALEH